MNNRPYRATVLISEDITLNDKHIWLDMNLTFGDFETQNHAEKVASSVQDVTFIVDDGIPKIHVSEKHDGVTANYYISNDGIEFKKVKDTKQQNMGEPIDCSTEEGKAKALEVLTEMDENYIITEDDLEPFEFSLEEMKKHFKHGYHLQNLAYGTTKI